MEPRREWIEDLAGRRLLHLGDLASHEKLAEASGELRRIEELHAEAARRWPQGPILPPLGRAVLALGRGFYWIGELDRAKPLLERALATGDAPDAIEMLAAMGASQLPGQGAERASLAAALYAEAAAKAPAASAAKLLRRRGEALARAGRGGEATDAWRGALRLWQELLLREPEPDALAEIEIERARALHALGRRDEALRAIERAIEVSPERGATYVDAVAFLTARGEYDDALDVYHQAMGLAKLDDYAKAYSSLWICDLGRRLGRPALIAERWLREVDGDEWYFDLSRFFVGTLAYDALERKADTRGKRTELRFYRAQQQLAEGKLDQARALWREVVASRMLAFYEYEMAAHYLAEGEGR